MAFLQMSVFARSLDVKNAYDILVKYHDDTGVTEDGPYDVTTSGYNEIYNEVRAVSQQIKRLFARFLPKVDEPSYEWGKKGIRFDTKRYVKRMGTGYESPMGRRETPEKNAFVLQILVDVSGSMYDGVRINNAVKACVAICEAAKEHNIFIEILASDHENVGNNDKYGLITFVPFFT